MTTTSLQVMEGGAITNANPFAADIVAGWIKFCDVRPATQLTYDKAVKSFIGYLSGKGIAQPTRDDIIAYREWLIDENGGGYKATSARLYMTVVKKFFRYLASENIYTNVADGVKLPTDGDADKHKRDALTLEEARAAIDSFAGAKSEKELRDKCIMGLMIGAGLRSVEIIRLNVGDIERRRGVWFINVTGKGRDGKAPVQISNELKKLVDEYLAVRPAGKKNSPMFISTARRNRGERLQTQSISRLAKKVIVAIGVDSERVTCHSCRHTAATMMLDAGVPIRQVANILRHRSVATTEIYAHDVDAFTNKGVVILSSLLFRKG